MSAAPQLPLLLTSCLCWEVHAILSTLCLFTEYNRFSKPWCEFCYIHWVLSANWRPHCFSFFMSSFISDQFYLMACSMLMRPFTTAPEFITTIRELFPYFKLVSPSFPAVNSPPLANTMLCTRQFPPYFTSRQKDYNSPTPPHFSPFFRQWPSKIHLSFSFQDLSRHHLFSPSCVPDNLFTANCSHTSSQMTCSSFDTQMTQSGLEGIYLGELGDSCWFLVLVQLLNHYQKSTPTLLRPMYSLRSTIR
jgi:hypothetical protein